MDKVKKIDSRIIRIKLVDGTMINGQVNISKDPGYDRVSDLMGSSNEEFVVVFGATSFHSDSEEPFKHKVLFINKRHIVWASPEENQR